MTINNIIIGYLSGNIDKSKKFEFLYKSGNHNYLKSVIYNLNGSIFKETINLQGKTIDLKCILSNYSTDYPEYF